VKYVHLFLTTLPAVFVIFAVAEKSWAQPPSSPAPPPAQSSITIAFGVEVCMTIEGAPDASTLSHVIGALTARDRFR